MKRIKDIIIGLVFGYIMIMFVIPAYIKYQQVGSIGAAISSQVQSNIITVGNREDVKESVPTQSSTLSFDGSGIDVKDENSEGMFNEKRANMTAKERHDSRVHSDGSICDHLGFSDN